MKEKMEEVVQLIDDLLNDVTVPRNVKRKLTEAKDRLKQQEEPSVKISATIYIIESLTEDINLPPHARNQLWAILGALETMKEK